MYLCNGGDHTDNCSLKEQLAEQLAEARNVLRAARLSALHVTHVL